MYIQTKCVGATIMGDKQSSKILSIRSHTLHSPPTVTLEVWKCPTKGNT